MGTAERLERARQAYARCAWEDAYCSFSSADARSGLGGDDLDRLAEAAYMLGRDDELPARARARLPRAPRRRRRPGGRPLRLLGRPDAAAPGRGGARQRVVRPRASGCSSASSGDCVERGYLLIPACWRTRRPRRRGRVRDGGARPPRSASASATATSSRSPCTSRATRWSGWGASSEGLRLLDEAMVAVDGGRAVADRHRPRLLQHDRVLPGARSSCAARASGPTALTRWCEQQPEHGRPHRRLPGPPRRDHAAAGAWDDALEEARRAGERFGEGVSTGAAGEGRSTARARSTGCEASSRAAEDAYREASRCGCEPQPGLALLRLAQGRDDAAAAAIRRALAEATRAARRVRAASRLRRDHARGRRRRGGARGLPRARRRRRRYDSDMLRALAAHAAGAVALAEGDARRGPVGAAAAWRAWQELEVPYEAARVRVLVGARVPARSATRTPPRWSSRPPATCSTGSARRRTSRRVDALTATGAAAPRADAARARGAAPGRGRRDQQGDRRRARDQRAHGRPPREQHLREAAPALAHRRERVRVRARPRVWSEMTTLAASRLVDPGDAERPRAP